MKILYVAELVDKTGVYAFKQALPELRGRYPWDFLIINADGATGGNGLGRNHAAYLRKLGANVLTMGECCFYKKDLTENIEKIPYVLRPENLNPGAPGFGSRIFKTDGARVAVAVLLGQSGFSRLHGNNPFAMLPPLLERLRQETPYVIVDFHASATAEKQTLFAAADGLCSAVIGSHSRVQTSDQRVLPGGTAVISDAGRTGSAASVGGSDADSRIQEYLSGIPDWTRETWARPELQGVYLDIGGGGKAISIQRVKVRVPEAPRQDTQNSESPSSGEAPAGEASSEEAETAGAAGEPQ